ncbi:MAG: hypothetical protein HY656_01900 [Acidobacteria bacterium]|nr:hypothetical protein [Acidobacteriota bacterium]
MKRALGSLFGGLLALGVAAVPAAGAPQQMWTANYPLASGGQVEVINIQGSISVEGWDRAEVELTVLKTGVQELGQSDVSIAVEPRPNALRVRTVYLPGAESSIQVDYRLRVPRQVVLEALHTVNGDIVVRDVEGAVEAHTLNGDIEETGVAGSLVARTLNGDVRVSLRRLPEPGGRVQLESVNGDLTLRLPADAAADLELSTVAGRIESPLLVETRSPGSDTRLRTRLGRGGIPILMRTIRGSIRLAASEGLL